MLHEMAHLYNLENGIKDTSRAGTYHNAKFKATAEEHGLICERSEIWVLNYEDFPGRDARDEPVHGIHRQKVLPDVQGRG